MNFFPIILSLPLLILSCSSIAKSIFIKPKISITKIQIKNVDLFCTELKIKLLIDNPNAISIPINQLQYKFSVEGEELAKGKTLKAVNIEAKKKNIFEIPVKLQYSGLSTGIKTLLNKEFLTYQFKAYIEIDTPIGDLGFNLKEENKIPIPNLPSFVVEKIELKDFSITSATINFYFKIINNEDFKINLQKFNYNIQIQNIPIASSQAKIKKSLDQDKNISIKIPINFKLLGFRRSLIKILQEGKVDYKIKFDLYLKSKYGEFLIPYQESAVVSIYQPN